jgi:phosphoribosylglycinamide formyltransferase-1
LPESPIPNPRSRPFRLVVLASGRGTNFAALAAAAARGTLPVEIAALLSDRRSAPALELAESRGIATVALRPREFADRASFDRALFARARNIAPDLLVLAGYMRIIDAAVVRGWSGRMINLHPSLLPKYPGLDTHARALAAGDTVHGASVHYVTDELDGGPVIARVEMPVLPGDTAETLAARLRPLEHGLLVAVVGAIAAGRVALGSDGVEVDGEPLAQPLVLGADGALAGL